MAEELFTDIINNLGKSLKKAKQEGKLQGGYRFADDGKIKLGGGYYDEDKMLQVEIGKDGGNILFKKRFADGGNVASLEASIQSLYKDFGQALVDSESLSKHGKSIRDITIDQRRNLKARLNKYKSFIKENNRMPSKQEAIVAGRKQKDITDSTNKDGNKKTDDDIRKDMSKKGKTVRIYQGKSSTVNL